MIKMLNMDCMEYMRTVPDKYFDLAIVDPPYGIDVTKMNMGGRKTVKKDLTKSWDSGVPDDAYFLELFRISKAQVIWGGELLCFALQSVFCNLGQRRDNVRARLCRVRVCLG